MSSKNEEEQILIVKEKLTKYYIKQLKRAELWQAKNRLQLNHCLQWETVHHKGLLLQSQLYRLKRGMREVTLLDWAANNQEVTISLDPKEDPHRTVAKLFRKSKKLRIGIEHWKKLVKKAEEETKRIEKIITDIKEAQSLEDLPIVEKTKIEVKERKEAKKALPYKTFYSSSGLKILVGKGAKENDLLTFQYGNGSDWWLHVKDFPGSHVVLKVKKGEAPSHASVQEAAQLAVGYSKAKEKGKVSVCVTQCKYVKRLGKQPGKVQISKHQTIDMEFDRVFFNAIKDQQMP